MPKDFNVLTVLALIFVHIYSSLFCFVLFEKKTCYFGIFEKRESLSEKNISFLLFYATACSS